MAGDFEHGAGGVPKGWDKVAGQQREPLGGLVRWTTEKGNPPTKSFASRSTENVAENEGVMYYSDFFPVEEGATYRFQCRWRSDAPAAKVFIKCYDADESGRRREVYRSQQNLKGPNGKWNTQTEDFTPKHTKYSPKWGRVMLYAYLNPGEVEFDDVVVKQIRARRRRQGRQGPPPFERVEDHRQGDGRERAAQPGVEGREVDAQPRTELNAQSGTLRLFPRDFGISPLMFYYEVTLACDLVCKHCRASAQEQPHPDELSTAAGEGAARPGRRLSAPADAGLHRRRSAEAGRSARS